LACYMVEVSGSKDWRTLKTMLYTRPDLLHRILDTNARTVAQYLNCQIEHGAQVIQIFDTWGGTLSTEAFQTFSLHYIKQVIGSLKREHNGSRIPVIVFTKGGGQWLELLAESGADAIGLDWTTDIANARARIGSKTALQGNLDPAVLFGTPEAVRTEAARILAGYGHGSGHVFNLGHGISQFADPENVRILIDTVHSESRRYHA
ncbi:MAG: uroporphyrinogen decarboxylase, partial [Neisseria sp.]